MKHLDVTIIPAMTMALMCFEKYSTNGVVRKVHPSVACLGTLHIVSFFLFFLSRLLHIVCSNEALVLFQRVAYVLSLVTSVLHHSWWSVHCIVYILQLL